MGEGVEEEKETIKRRRGKRLKVCEGCGVVIKKHNRLCAKCKFLKNRWGYDL